MVGVQLGGEDGVQHSSFCIQINDIRSSGKSGPLATLLASPMSSMQICPQHMGKGAAQVCSALLVQLLVLSQASELLPPTAGKLCRVLVQAAIPNLHHLQLYFITGPKKQASQAHKLIFFSLTRRKFTAGSA